jgi:hypothetical protein
MVGDLSVADHLPHRRLRLERVGKALGISGMVLVGSPQPMEMITIKGGKDAITIRAESLAEVP